MPEEAAAVYLTLRCLEPGCLLGEQRCSVGRELDDAERMESAEGFVSFCARRCRLRHAAGVEACFSDDPTRRIIFSQQGGTWDAS